MHEHVCVCVTVTLHTKHDIYRPKGKQQLEVRFLFLHISQSTHKSILSLSKKLNWVTHFALLKIKVLLNYVKLWYHITEEKKMAHTQENITII